MSNSLLQRSARIAQTRATTPRHQFVHEIASRLPLAMYRNNGLISRYPQTPRSPQVISNKSFSDERDTLLTKGTGYDSQSPTGDGSDQSFFDQLQALWHATPLSATITQLMTSNVDYADSCVASSNCYLTYVAVESCNEIYYSAIVFDNCKNVFNSVYVTEFSENVYRSTGVIKSFNVYYSRYITNSNDMWFSTNCIGCHYCIGCDGLENQSYCFQNQQLTREAWMAKKEELLTQGSKFESRYSKLNKQAVNYNTTDSQGNMMIQCSNLHNGYYTTRVTNSRNCIFVGATKEENMIDCVDAGVNSTHIVACEGVGTNSSHVYCSTQVENSSFIYYSYYLNSCSHCIGCIGLRNAHYCILNKQYTKEDWEQKSGEIFQKMEEDRTLGKFLPASMNPFYYNDTMASLFGSIEKEQALADGYLRRDEPNTISLPAGKTATKEFPAQFDQTVTQTIFEDVYGDVFTIIPQEYAFLSKHKLPLPRVHYLRRLREQVR